EHGFQKISGYAYIKQVNTVIEIAIYEDTLDFFEQLSLHNVNELNYLLPEGWTDANTHAWRVTTEQVTCPAINFGAMHSSNVIPNRCDLPTSFYCAMVTMCFQVFGCT